MPFIPKKCCGKNVMFTPMNMARNWIFRSFGLIDRLNISGNQCTMPAMIANTAPIERT